MIDEEGRLRRIDYGDRVFYDSFTGIAGVIYPIGTSALPSSVIANALTILAARNLKALDIHGAATLDMDVNHKDFFGNYHESVADIVTLAAGNDVDDSHFEGLIITGAQGGTLLATYKECLLLDMTGFRGLAENCAIFGSLAVAVGGANDYADFDHCTSVHGQITVTVGDVDRLSFKEFSGGMILADGAAGSKVLVRGISGYLEVDNMDGGALDIYAHGADIQINADCGGGIINIYGDARVTVVAGAAVTVNDYGSSGYKELSATGTTTNVYANALDIDARLYHEFTIKIKNTDGADSLDYRVLLRPEHGVAEQMIQPEDITLAPADYDFVNIDHKWGQVIVQVRDTVADSHADFSVYAICNKQ